jgi:nucleotide-binding universal stress UspA family protein
VDGAAIVTRGRAAGDAMQRLLLPFDGSDNALRAVRHAIGLAKTNPPVHVHLLNVTQPPILYGEVAVYVDVARVKDLQRRESLAVLSAGEALLREAGVEFSSEALVGEVAQTIAERADRLGCTAIVMGTRGMGAVANLLLGSVATRVVHLTRLPVTLIK